ncbi:hypothetical protein Y1Q_0007609 [Alligator mississippiensis]|uniref:Uncharacterized protein n=1 Tax=Alligator mississippiensis TaxID=8496 RepID=A0A151NBY9_ALLMI|nr:hypothetical protein Y1Q_0007609 [Alligator mississippiensis]
MRPKLQAAASTFSLNHSSALERIPTFGNLKIFFNTTPGKADRVGSEEYLVTAKTTETAITEEQNSPG